MDDFFDDDVFDDVGDDVGVDHVENSQPELIIIIINHLFDPKCISQVKINYIMTATAGNLQNVYNRNKIENKTFVR